VNILRDLPADLKKGRCYLPLEKLEPAGLLPEILLSPVNEAKFHPLFYEYLDRAESHLVAGWAYTNTLPFGQVRVRLACAWPILIGVKTIERLRAATWLNCSSTSKFPTPSGAGFCCVPCCFIRCRRCGKNYFSRLGKLLHPKGK